MQAAATHAPPDSADELGEPVPKVPNSPSSAFACLSLDDDDDYDDGDCNDSSQRPTGTSQHMGGNASKAAEVASATRLVEALDAARKRPKPLIRSTGHRVQGPRDEQHHLLSWKTSEFAYRKSSTTGSDLPTLARGLFTERLLTRDGSVQHRVAVRGYDKFFNLAEMPWTRPEAIRAYTVPPYILTFKENGCIIFIAALSDHQLVVTSKHSTGALDGVAVTHAQKGEEWLDVHLARAAKTREQLARELWQRNETAVFELCDDSFEEHVLEYPAEKSGLHLHGLNANSATFRTRPMDEVDAFAREWGFIPTRYIEVASLAELHELTDRIGMSGSWEGEPIEGFVIRTRMPSTDPAGQSSGGASTEAESSSAGSTRAPVSPPYAPGQTWFYKVKFDEPYLMYRDWRELTRKMLSQKAAWEKTVHARGGGGSGANTIPGATGPATVDEPISSPAEPATTEATSSAAADADADADTGEAKVSKSQLKREKKKLEREKREAEAKQRAAAIQAGIAPPEPPQARSKRPETLIFIQWCYDRLYGANGVKARPDLFATFGEGKGIIALRNTFLDYLKAAEGQQKLAALGGGGGDGSNGAAVEAAAAEDTRPFTKTLITPIAVPGCGKTVLAVALSELFGFAHVQSDDFKGKKGFLASVDKELQAHDVVFADKNNHLFQQRDELIELMQKRSDPNQVVKPPSKKKKGKGGGEDEASAAPPAIPRIRTVAVAWQLDALPLNALHRICSDRILARGDNHQTLRADTTGAAGTRDHETFDETIWLGVDEGLEASLRRIVKGLCPMLGLPMPDDARIEAALAKAVEYKPAVKRETKSEKKSAGGAGDKDAVEGTGGAEAEAGAVAKAGSGGGGGVKVRYYGIAVELDLHAVLGKLFDEGQSSDASSEAIASGREFFHQLRQEKRITLRPHITLVHSAAVAKEQESQSITNPEAAETKDAPAKQAEDVAGATARWERYADLCRPSNDVVEFDMVLDRLIWDGRVMALSVRDVSSASVPDFEAVQGGRGGQGQGRWRPHVTVGTAAQDIRPVEANRALMEAEDGKQGVFQIPIGQGGTGVRAKGRLQGMNH
ncbi:uncharacterized protein PFL1_02870 [Pseudozyma flocculosa PF-1]|uniref:tRNA ligase n=1 Tax=Pseudozyma flocculosa PF-1 TaxID=1277687 RepID=A0A061HC84_9BASI|nr:uncharacterized protein PFL1_02870 [Pseudozyma flocculosa PF-1]EPQ29650.1 hypothetical protein PFL1_02870 [Pseudozyma flocculosa PF-1]